MNIKCVPKKKGLQKKKIYTNRLCNEIISSMGYSWWDNSARKLYYNDSLNGSGGVCTSFEENESRKWRDYLQPGRSVTSALWRSYR